MGLRGASGLHQHAAGLGGRRAVLLPQVQCNVRRGMGRARHALGKSRVANVVRHEPLAVSTATWPGSSSACSSPPQVVLLSLLSPPVASKLR